MLGAVYDLTGAFVPLNRKDFLPLLGHPLAHIACDSRQDYEKVGYGLKKVDKIAYKSIFYDFIVFCRFHG